MFEEPSESSYSCSFQKDVPFRGIIPIGSSEIEGLGISSSRSTEEDSMGAHGHARSPPLTVIIARVIRRM